MSNEKAPLIPRFDASHARAEAAPRPQRCASKKTAVKVIVATAAAGILYYGVPEGNQNHLSDDMQN
jgi:endothelin-converting enzyme